MKKFLIISFLIPLISCNFSNKDEKIELWTIQLKPTFNDYMNKIISKFEKDNNQKVEWIDLPSKEIEQKTLTAIAGGKSPDLVNMNPNFMSKLAEENALADIETLINKDVKKEFLENIWNASSYGNKTFSIPWYLSTAVTIYNKEIFQKAGLDINKPPKTFDDIKIMGEKIRKIGKYIFMPNFADTGKFLEFMIQEGIPLLDKNKKKAIFDNQKAIDFLNFWIDLAKKNIIPKDSITQGHREAIDKFQAGQTAILVSGPQFLNIIKQNNPNLYSKISVSEQLTGKSGKFGVGIMNFVIPLASKKKEKSIKLAEFITNKENQLEFTKIANILPSIKSALDDNYFKEIKNDKDLNDIARNIASKQLLKASVLLPNINKWSELSKIFDKYFQMAFIGQIKPEEAIRKANQEWNKILEE